MPNISSLITALKGGIEKNYWRNIGRREYVHLYQFC